MALAAGSEGRMADNGQEDIAADGIASDDKAAVERSVEALIDDARSAMIQGGRSGGYSLAYTILTSFDLTAEQESEMHFLKGLGLFRMGNFKDAIADLDEVIYRDRLHVAAHHLRADCYREMFEWRKAAEGYSRVIILEPENALAYFRRASESDDSLERKIADLSEAISAKGDFREAYEARGRCYIDSRQFEQALADFSKALELYPAYCDALCWRALAHYELGRYQEALSDCDHYAAIGLGNIRCDGLVRDLRSKSFASLGESSSVILATLKPTEGSVVQAEDLPPPAGRRSGEQLAEEWRALADAIDQASSFDNNIQDQGTGALIAFSLEASKSDYSSNRRIIASVSLVFTRESSLPFKTRINLLLARGQALLAEREYSHAILDFNWLVEAEDRPVEAYRLRARAHEKLGDAKAAIRDYTLLLAIAPDDAAALAHISWLLVIGGGLSDDAVSLAKRALKLDDATWIQNNLAAAYAAAGDFDMAINEQNLIIQRLYQNADYAAIPAHQQALDYYRWGYTTWGNEHYTWLYQGLSERPREAAI
jgi:tetratricopeptide (TPR) repeat protein